MRRSYTKYAFIAQGIVWGLGYSAEDARAEGEYYFGDERIGCAAMDQVRYDLPEVVPCTTKLFWNVHFEGSDTPFVHDPNGKGICVPEELETPQERYRRTHT